MDQERIFNTTDQDIAFWTTYLHGRPSPPEAFLELINQYHARHSQARDVAHDVGTGPGNIAARLTKYYDHVVGSDMNKLSLAAAPVLFPDAISKMTLVASPAEQLADGILPESVGIGKADLVLASECMPLLEPAAALKAFHSLLKPNGTLAIYIYGRPILDDARLDALYETISTKICRFMGPFAGTPGYAYWHRAVLALDSWLDNIELSAEDWQDEERVKWNADIPLLFNSKDGYDFEVESVRPAVAEKIIDRSNWQHDWDMGHVRSYLDGVHPQWRKRAGDRASEVEPMLEEFELTMGERHKVGFPVCLIMATKRS